MHMRLTIIALIGLVSFGGARAQAVDPALETVTVFAAASTKPALDALAPTLQARGVALRIVVAGSSALARQIAAGAPADLFISANAAWMDKLEREGLLVQGTRTVIATNRLVLIAHAPLEPASSAPTLPWPPVAPSAVALGPDYPLRETLQGGRLAIADPDHVPAGLYARQALTALGLWNQVQDRLARSQDVTGALLLVVRGETPLGIVYASDAGRTRDVQVYAAIPSTAHAPIVYPAAILQDHDSPAVRRVLAVLRGPEGQSAFAAAGFGAAP